MAPAGDGSQLNQVTSLCDQEYLGRLLGDLKKAKLQIRKYRWMKVHDVSYYSCKGLLLKFSTCAYICWGLSMLANSIWFLFSATSKALTPFWVWRKMWNGELMSTVLTVWITSSVWDMSAPYFFSKTAISSNSKSLATSSGGSDPCVNHNTSDYCGQNLYCVYF